jgi:hypothetical protein
MPRSSTLVGRSLLDGRAVLRVVLGALLALVAAPAVAAPASAAAQESDRTLAFVGGAFYSDLGDPQWAPLGGGRLEVPLTPALLMEVGLGYARYRARAGGTAHHFLPDLLLQVQLPRQVYRPYVGAGLGTSWERRPEENVTQLSLVGAGGMRVVVSDRWSLLGEVRARAIGPWLGSSVDLTLGVGRLL